jgi:purine-binding chemotaxis protein CheW
MLGAMGTRVGLLRFRLGGERFAIRAESVVEVVPSAAVAPLPFAAGVVAGALVVRGDLLPVFDVRGVLRLPERPVAVDDHFVVALAGGRTLALVTEGVEDLVTVGDETLVPAHLLSARGPAGANVAQLEDGTWAVLDLGAFLTAAEQQELDAVLGEATSR